MPSLTRTLFVDHGPATSSQDGSVANPYLSIQAAVFAVPVPTIATFADSDDDWIILIAPGDYDEHITINGPIRIALIGMGAFRLGRYTTPGTVQPKQTNVVADSGATPRSITWTYENTPSNPQFIPGGAAPQLVIGTIGGTDTIRHGKPIANRISGSIVVKGDGWTPGNVPNGGTAFLTVSNTQVDAGITKSQAAPTLPAINTTAFSGGLVDRHFNSRFRGAILSPMNGVAETPPSHGLVTSIMSQYERLVEVTQYGSIQQAAFAAGMSVSRAPITEASPFLSGVPPGMVNSTFSGAFELKTTQNLPPADGAGTLLLDAVTNTWFIRNGATLAGGATKSFLGGSSQTLYISEARTLTVSDCGVTLLTDSTPGSFTVTLPIAAGMDDLTFTIRNIGTANKVTVMPVNNALIDGERSLVLIPRGPGQGVALSPSGIKVVAQGGNWWIVSQAGGR